MALVVEDGTGLASANGYISVADADAYFAERGESAWAGDDTAKGAAIVRATDYIEARFGARWRGIEASDTQALSWPRDRVYTARGIAVEGVPAPIATACALYALRALTATLDPDPPRDASGQELVEATDTVGPITETRVYQPGARTQPAYPAADRLIAPFVLSGQRHAVR